MRHFVCYFRVLFGKDLLLFLTKKVISAILEVFFDKDLPWFLTKTFSKTQNCGLQKLLRISSKNELLLKKISDSKRMTFLDIKTYHYDIFTTNTIEIMEVSKTYKISLSMV